MPKIPDAHSVQIGVLAGLGNLLIFQHFLPPVSDVKRADPHNRDIEGSERTALFVAIAFTAVVAGFVKSWNTFLVAGMVLVGADFAYKHANAVNPQTGNMQPAEGQNGSIATEDESQAPLPDYSMAG